MIGRVKWFNSAKGYGFIESPDEADIFVHYSAITNDGYKNLMQGQEVEFEISNGPKGPQAENVTYNDDGDSMEGPSFDGQLPGEDLVAFALFDDKIRMVSLSPDGGYRILDENQNLHNVFYVTSSETMALQIAVEELETLINDRNAKEKDFQSFFERYPDFLINDDYKKAHPQIVLANDEGESFIPDFILEPLNQSSLCDLLELKLPSTQIFVLQKKE